MNNRDQFAPFFLPLFELLRSEQVPYCVLRNYDRLPRAIPGTDIDILTTQRGQSEFRGIVERACAISNWTLVFESEKDFRIIHFVVADLESKGPVPILPLDVMSVVGWRGVTVLTAQDVLQFAKSRQGVMVIPPPVAAAVVLVNSLLFVGEISKKKYADQIERSIESHSDSFHEVLNSAFGAAAAGQLVDSISSHGIVELARMQPIARRTVSRRIWRHPMRAIKDKIHLAKFSISRVASPPGPFVCILGIDGSGKSTVSDIIADQLKSSFSPVKQLHLRPRFLPELHKVAFWRSCTSVSEPISGRVPSGMGSLVRWFYYYVDYLIGYQFRVRPTLARKGIAIADRYFYDFRFDHAQKMVRLPESLIVFTQRFLPSPDAVVHIRVPSEIATKRRQGEISAEEADRQLVRIDQIVGEMDNGYVVVNDRSPTKAADSVIRLLFQELADSRLSR